ncbi:hypothetical protein AAE478_007768 [Parahypoxylon ruwenzoriense]
MNNRPGSRRSADYGSDTSSVYSARPGSVRSVDSGYSVWSSSESDSFVWRDDPWGFYGVAGAVTRFVDERDNRRQRFAAHILSGPFAQFYKKQRPSSSGSRSGRKSAGSSRSSSRSSSGGSSPARPPQHQQYHSRPASVEPQFHQEQFHPPEFHDFHNFQGPPPPPPPPPPPFGAPAAGFENGFIQLGGPGGPPPPPPPPQMVDPVWGHPGYGPGAPVYD